MKNAKTNYNKKQKKTNSDSHITTTLVSQGYVLEPLLFLIDTNWNLVIYADDISLYQIIQTPADYILLQQAIFKWTIANFLALNLRKCWHLLFPHNRSPHPSTCTCYRSVEIFWAELINMSTWESSCPQTYLSSVQKFYPHSALNHWHFYWYIYLYQTLICPHLEYACSVWDPQLKKDIERLKSIHNFGLKVCLKQWHYRYENLLELSNVPAFTGQVPKGE